MGKRGTLENKVVKRESGEFGLRKNFAPAVRRVQPGAAFFHSASEFSKPFRVQGRKGASTALKNVSTEMKRVGLKRERAGF